jgi:hypothetical protein
MSQKFHIFPQIHASNVFSMHDVCAQNVWIMNEWILHDFHFKIVMKVFEENKNPQTITSYYFKTFENL